MAGWVVHRVTVRVADLGTKQGLDYYLGVLDECGVSDLCTTVSSLQNINVAKYGAGLLRPLMRRRRRILIIFQHFIVLAHKVAAQGCSVTKEWRRRCRGWELRPVVTSLASLSFTNVIVDWCALGMTVARGAPLLKPWTL